MEAAEAIGEWKGNGDTPTKHNKTKHDEMKSKKNKDQLTNIRTTQQAQTYRMDSTTKNGTLLAKYISRTI